MRNRYVPRRRQRPLTVVRVQRTQRAGFCGLAVFDVEDEAVVTGRCRQPDRTGQTLIEEAEGKLPVERGLLPAVETARWTQMKWSRMALTAWRPDSHAASIDVIRVNVLFHVPAKTTELFCI